MLQTNKQVEDTCRLHLSKYTKKPQAIVVPNENALNDTQAF